MITGQPAPFVVRMFVLPDGFPPLSFPIEFSAPKFFSQVLPPHDLQLAPPPRSLKPSSFLATSPQPVFLLKNPSPFAPENVITFSPSVPEIFFHNALNRSSASRASLVSSFHRTFYRRTPFPFQGTRPFPPHLFFLFPSSVFFVFFRLFFPEFPSTGSFASRFSLRKSFFRVPSSRNNAPSFPLGHVRAGFCVYFCPPFAAFPGSPFSLFFFFFLVRAGRGFYSVAILQ